MTDDSSDHSATIAFLVGIVVLVFAGIVFSLLVDKRFKFSSGRAVLGDEVNDGALQLEKLKFRIDVSKEQWRKQVQPLAGQEQQLKALSGDVLVSGEKLGELRERWVSLNDEVTAGNRLFRDYRDEYRRQARSAANGEKLAELTSLSGRTYNDVTISRVTVDGLEIRHAEGISRLRPEDLDDSWHDRFQWSPEEQAEVPEAPKPPVSGDPDPAGKPESGLPETIAEQEEAKKLAGLRREVSEALRFLDKAEAELARARAEAGAKRGRSVPGSLETWAEKVKRMESLNAKFREQYVAARAKLAAAAPDDPLLRMPAP